ncbi:lysophospholipid acyltransferase family protein [Aquabacterium sp.]|uniref:lysophospholipid acyltransferase family protein n=1 Tax=Aquabacterium sp. TaxID=1872578 RepID=UPI0025C593F9|nr:lysophospholipid acyltransferase family protein [Aquabacterium sp.]
MKLLFFVLIVRPLVLLLLGLNVVHRERLPRQGPAILAANHNSHLDTMVLMSLMPLRLLPKVRPVAAADYFLSNRWLAWFSLNVIGIIPLTRLSGVRKEVLFEACHQALESGHILIIFPEGSRGAPEVMQPLKKGLHHLAKPHQGLRVIPVVMHGLGKALPKGDPVLVPFNCDVVVGEDVPMADDAEVFMLQLKSAFMEQIERCMTRPQLQED